MDTEVVGLSRYVAAIRRRSWLVLAAMLVFGAAVAGYVETRPATYTASAQVLIKPYSAGQFAEAEFSSSQVATQVAVMRSLAVVGPTVAKLHLTQTPSALQKTITAASVGDTSVIAVTVTRSTATQAAQIANQMVTQYIAFRQTHQPAGAHNANYAVPIDTAQPPTRPAGPSLEKGGLYGVILGLVIGCIAALVVDRRDKAISSETSLAEITGEVPVVGRIPKLKSGPPGPSLVKTAQAPDALAYRFLAATVRRFSQAHRQRTTDTAPLILMVASAAPRDGRTSVAANLALAAAEAGQRVLVCDADLTQPSLTKLLGVDNDVTLERVLRRSVPLDLDLLALPAPNVYALGSNGVVTSASALLADSSLRDLLTRFPNHIDLVIVDTSPLLSSPDVLDLVTQADLLLLVVREGVSKAPDVTAALDHISRVGGEPAGIVMTGSRVSLGTQRATRRRATPAIVPGPSAPAAPTPRVGRTPAANPVPPSAGTRPAGPPPPQASKPPTQASNR